MTKQIITLLGYAVLAICAGWLIALAWFPAPWTAIASVVTSAAAITLALQSVRND